VTELSQLLLHNTDMFGEATAQSLPHKVAVRLCAAVKLTENIKLFGVEAQHVPQCPMFGDAIGDQLRTVL